tara:strand:+ start:51 stop:296 length:246 start_codon:yes stop_codon:yes gene_type:complete
MTNQQKSEMKELTDYLILLATKNNPIGIRFANAVQSADKEEMQACYKLAFEHRQSAYKKMLNNLCATSQIVAKKLHKRYCK